MTKKEVLRRIQAKLAKLHTYNHEAHNLWGPEIARELYVEDLDFYASLLGLIGPDSTDQEQEQEHQ